jgi:hypothetical protein
MGLRRPAVSGAYTRSKSFRNTRQIRVSVPQELIPARVGELGNKAFGTELGEVIAKRGQCVVVGVAAEGFDDGGVGFGSGEGIASRDVSEADERMHQGELPR